MSPWNVMRLPLFPARTGWLSVSEAQWCLQSPFALLTQGLLSGARREPRCVRSDPIRSDRSTAPNWSTSLIATDIMNSREGGPPWTADSYEMCVVETFIACQKNPKGRCRYQDFWDVTPCGSCKIQRFGGTKRLHHQGDKNR
jgi:hypothetical protein